jgi:diguanylate cyclase (GGDEF)-like protein/PAS domain S-box-containing protein
MLEHSFHLRASAALLSAAADEYLAKHPPGHYDSPEREQRKMPNPEDLLRVTLDSIRDAVVTTDQAARVRRLNRAAEAMTGWSSAEAVGKPVEEIAQLREPGSELDLPHPVQTVLKTGNRVELGEHVLLIAKDGRRTSVQIVASSLQDAQGQASGCLLTLHDIGEALQLAERIARLAHHDQLTGLPNRILFVDRMEQATKAADRSNDQIAVIFVDLDHFSRIKTAHGNALADQFLQEAAHRILAALRESDTVSRLGADEFVLLVPGVNSVADIEAVAAKLLEEIAKPSLLGGQTLQTSCSIGISIYPRDASDANTLIRLADGAMRQAKREGRNRYLFANVEAPGTKPLA